jgi:hypothetical protein
MPFYWLVIYLAQKPPKKLLKKNWAAVKVKRWLGGAGILPVRRTGWKPVPPMHRRADAPGAAGG